LGQARCNWFKCAAYKTSENCMEDFSWENEKERDFLEDVWGTSEVHVKWVLQK